jgi:hypothetical protein
MRLPFLLKTKRPEASRRYRNGSLFRPRTRGQMGDHNVDVD